METLLARSLTFFSDRIFLDPGALSNSLLARTMRLGPYVADRCKGTARSFSS